MCNKNMKNCLYGCKVKKKNQDFLPIFRKQNAIVIMENSTNVRFIYNYLQIPMALSCHPLGLPDPKPPFFFGPGKMETTHKNVLLR